MNDVTDRSGWNGFLLVGGCADHHQCQEHVRSRMTHYDHTVGVDGVKATEIWFDSLVLKCYLAANPTVWDTPKGLRRSAWCVPTPGDQVSELKVKMSQPVWFRHLLRMLPGCLPLEVFWVWDYMSNLAWDHLGVPQEEPESVAGEREHLMHPAVTQPQINEQDDV